MAEIVDPTVRGMAAEGMPYQGFLYVGLMIAPDGAPRVVEYNCRFGDPEAQPVLTRLRSDLAVLCHRALGDGVSGMALDWDPRAALAVVLAAGGYPLAYSSGDPISGLDDDIADTKVFHAGTRSDGGNIVTSGGRVLAVVGLGDDIVAAQAKAYARVARIGWRGVQYRRDIGYRALARLADSGG